VHLTDRQTNKVKVTVALSNFIKTPNKARVANVFHYFEVRWVIINICTKLNKCDTCVINVQKVHLFVQ